MTTAHQWQFTSRFRRHTFGWRSALPIQRIEEAVAEIKAVACQEPVIAAEGAVTLLAKLSPALEQVDSSSGALGTAVNRAIDKAILLSSGLAGEAYRRYAIAANQGPTHLATFRAIARKYPDTPSRQIVRDLVASTPRRH